MVFALRADTLNPESLKVNLRNAGAGACATFEGWVRDNNEGQRVHRLAYEAYEELAVKEGERILEEARARFGLLHAHCEHRVGLLEIGDLAVWVGVSAPHRGEAFAACRFIIDEVKHRLPIWKKEFYTTGDSGWVNCERCAAHATPAVTEASMYARQTCLPEVGAHGQAKLKASRVLIVGAGGLGCPAAQYLTTAGVGTIGICDSDTVDASNLHRQPLFGPSDLGKPKASIAAERLRTLNPFTVLHTHATRLTSANAVELFSSYDLVLDCTDNFETKFLINDTAVHTKKPVVFASIYQYEGQLQVYDPARRTACLRCLWHDVPEPGCVGSCAEAGVLGAVPGVAGALQAMEALKHLLGLPGTLGEDIVFFDLLGCTQRRVRNRRRVDCPLCADGRDTAPSASPVAADVEVDAESLLDAFDAPFTIVDIREAGESNADPIGLPDVLQAPFSAFDWESPPAIMDRPLLLCCGRGVRSRSLALALRKRGYERVYSLRGGVSALRAARTVGP